MLPLATRILAVLIVTLSIAVQAQDPPGCPPSSQIFIAWEGGACDTSSGIPCDAGEQISFRPILIPANALCRDFVWDFGDGSISTEYAPRHAFATRGHHRVTLRASDDHRYSVVSTVLYLEDPWCGCNTGRGEVVVFQATPTVVTRGQPVVLTWTTRGASRLKIDPLNAEFPADPPYSQSSGSYTFIPRETARYTMTAYSFAANGLSAPVTVTVQDPPVRRRRVRK